MNTNLASELSAHISAASDRTIPTLRKLRREASRRLNTHQAADVFRISLQLLASPDVPKWFAYELVHHHRQAMENLNLRRLRELGHGMSAWHEVDPFACYLSGPAWREGRIGDKDVHRWARSTDRWWRRVAAVSTVPLNNTARGGRGDEVRTLAVCDLVKHDADDMVVKALSWALRELARKHPASVQRFLRSNEDVLAARVVREVRNKLETGLKNPAAGAKRSKRK